MKMFTDCSGECCVCGAGRGCVAGHGDDEYFPATMEQVVERLDNNKYPNYRDIMIEYLKTKYHYDYSSGCYILINGLQRVSVNLKPCPFCGSKHINNDNEKCGYYPRSYLICEKCKATIYGGWGLNGLEKAIEKWNTRPDNVVEVVRCHDCKNGRLQETLGLIECMAGDYDFSKHDPDDYCKYGKKRSDSE